MVFINIFYSVGEGGVEGKKRREEVNILELFSFCLVGGSII